MARSRGLSLSAIATPDGGTNAYNQLVGDEGDLYAGDFFIDTGYNDPVDYPAGVQGAEIYGARVYYGGGIISGSPPAGSSTGQWRLKGTPVWTATGTVLPGTQTVSRRIFIHVEAWVKGAFRRGTVNGWEMLTAVSWSLYRL